MFLGETMFQILLGVYSSFRCNNFPSQLLLLTWAMYMKLFYLCLFCQVFYLDSLDLGMLSLKHDLFPRIRAFNAENIKLMIQADRCLDSSGKLLDEKYGACNVS